MKTIFRILSFLACILILSNSSGATSTFSIGTITIVNGSNTLSQVYADINNPNVFLKSGNEYILNSNMDISSIATLRIEGETLKFNGTYRIHNNGNLSINNSTITSINSSNRGYIKSTRLNSPGYTFNLTNSIISYLGRIGLDDGVDIRAIQLCASPCATPGTTGARIPPIINNNIFEYNYRTLVADGKDDIVTNNTFRYEQGNVIAEINNHGTFDNNSIYNNINGRGYGILTWQNAIITNNTLYDNYISDGGAMIMIKEGDGGAIVRNNIFYNNTGEGTRIDITGSTHSVWSYIENNIMNDKYGTGITITSNGYLGQFVVYGIIQNNTIDGARQFGIRYVGAGFFAGGITEHVKVNNNIIRNTRIGILVEGLHANSTAVNNSVEYNPGYQRVDIEFGHFYDAGNNTPKFINLNYTSTLINTGRFLNYKFLDIKVIDENNAPINMAIINITNINDSNYPSIDINGVNKTSFLSGQDGHIPLPIGNETNSPAIIDFHKNPTYRQNMSYLISAYDPNHLYTSTPTLIHSNGTLLSLSPLATATVSPNSSWYRPNPNTYQNTTVITITRPRTNISLRFPNGSIMVSNATQTSLDATTDYPQSYVIINNTVPEFANKNLSFTADGITYANSTADSNGFVSFNYTGTWSKHTFEWVINPDGNVYLLDLIQVALHFGEKTSQPYPSYDHNTDGIVDISDVVLFAKEIV